MEGQEVPSGCRAAVCEPLRGLELEITLPAWKSRYVCGRHATCIKIFVYNASYIIKVCRVLDINVNFSYTEN